MRGGCNHTGSSNAETNPVPEYNWSAEQEAGTSTDARISESKAGAIARSEGCCRQYGRRCGSRAERGPDYHLIGQLSRCDT